MNLHLVGLVLSGVSIRASLNIGICGVKFDSKLTFEDHVRGNVSRVSQRSGILMMVKRIFVVTSVLPCCCYAFVPRCERQLLNITFRFSSARCAILSCFALIDQSFLSFYDRRHVVFCQYGRIFLFNIKIKMTYQLLRT